MRLAAALGLEHTRLVALSGAGGKTTLLFTLAAEYATAGERVLVTTTTHLARGELRGPVCMADDAAGIERGTRAARTGPGHVVAHSGDCARETKVRGFAPEIVDAVHRARLFDRILVEADGAARRPLKAPAAHEPVIPACCDALVIVAGLHGLGQPLDDAHLFRAGQWAALTGAVPGTPVSGEDLVRVVTHAHGLARGCPDGALQCLFLNRADTPARLDAARRIEQTLARVPGCRVTRVVAGSLLPRLRLAA